MRSSNHELKCLCEAILNPNNQRVLLEAYARSHLTVLEAKDKELGL
jgi:hypothetical protein